MKNRHRIASLALVAGLFSSTQASAAPPTKEECVEAHSRGQDARDKGQLTDSKRLFLLCAQSTCPALVQSDCAKFGDELARTVPSVAFVARDGRGADLLDTQVFVDGTLTMSRLDEGRSHDLDPGKHTVRFVHAGKDVTQVVVVSAGERGRTLTAVFEDAPPSTSLAGTSRPASDASEPSRSVVPLVVAGVGGAALAIGAVLLFTGLSAVPDNCSRDTNECAASPGDPAFADAKSAINQANLGLGIGIGGAAVAVGGLVWYLASSPRARERGVASRVLPWTDTRGAGAAWQVRFWMAQRRKYRDMTMKHALFVTTAMVTALVGAGVSCSPTFEPKACASDTDCGGELVCVARSSSARTCTAPSEAPLRIGQSAVASGPSGDLGLEMRRGIQLAFDDQNTRGGIRGRKLELDFLDDQYTPAIAEANARTLVDAVPGEGPPRCPTTQTPPVAGQDPFSQTALLAGPNAVTAVIGSVGTPTMVRAAPVIVETGTLYFGAFTGATAMLRDQKAGPCTRYIFNVRASYAQEARATLEFFFALKVPDDRHLISFDQNDTFGDAGYNGLVSAYQAIRDVTPSIQRFRYTREDPASVPAQIAAAISYLRSLLQADNLPHAVGVMMTDTYGPATQFVKAVKDWQYASDQEQTTLAKATRLTVSFSNVSFVGPNSLAARLRDAGNVTTPTGPKPYTAGVFVSQVVPNYDSDNSDVVLDYKRLVAPTGAAPTFTALEGYIAGRVFVEGLKNTQGPFTADTMVTAFETLRAGNLGLGASAGFSKEKHQYSQSVYGTEITPEGRFQNRYFWSDGSPIQLFE